MSPADPTLEHPVVAGLRAVSAGLHAVVAADQVWQLSDQQVETALATVFEVQANTAVLQGLLLGEADQRDLKSRTGAPNLVRWLGDRFRLSRPDAAARLRQAGDLLRHRPVRDALTAGAVTVEQATTAATTLDQVAALPGLTDQDRTAAATFLLQQCAALTPPELARAGQAVVEALTRTPSRDDPAEAAALDRDQQRAEADAQAAERNDLRVTRRRGRLRAVLDLGPLGEATLHAWLRRTGTGPAGRPPAPTACRTNGRPASAAATPSSSCSPQPPPATLSTNRTPTASRPRRVGRSHRWRCSPSPPPRPASAPPCPPPATWTPAAPSPPPPCGSWPATHWSSPPCSAAPPRSSTSAAAPGSGTAPNAAPPPCATAAAPPPAATAHPPAASSTTPGTGSTADPPT